MRECIIDVVIREADLVPAIRVHDVDFTVGRPCDVARALVERPARECDLCSIR